MNCIMPCYSIHHQLPELTETQVHWVSDAIQPFFANDSVLHIRCSKYLRTSFNISPSDEYSGLISFRMDLLAVQRTLQSLFQHHSSKASILRQSAFCLVQPSHTYMTIGKTTALTRQTSVGKVMYLLFNMLWVFAISFLPRSKCLKFMAAVNICSDFGAPQKIKSLFPLFSHLFPMKWWDQMPWSSFFECWVLSQHFHSTHSFSWKGSLVLHFLP